jgi:hypothetical protein
LRTLSDGGLDEFGGGRGGQRFTATQPSEVFDIAGRAG